MSRYVAWIERHHRFVVGVSCVVSLLAAASLTRLRLDMDVLAMLPRGRPAFDDFKSFVVDFGQLDELVVLIEGSAPSQLETFADSFASQLRTLDSVAAVHGRIEVDQILDGVLGKYLPNYVPLAGYGQLEDRLTATGLDEYLRGQREVLSAPFDLSAARGVLQDPIGMRPLAAAALADAGSQFRPDLSSGMFSSPERDAVLLFVRPKESAFDVAFSQRLLDDVRRAEATTRRSLGLGSAVVRYTGSYVYALEDAATLRSDITRYAGLALVAVLSVFFLGYGNLRILPFVTYPLLATALLTFALSLLIFDRLNAVSISFAAILYGLSIDSSIHFYSRLLEERSRDGSGNLGDAIDATLSSLGPATATGTLTTATGFFIVGLSSLTAVGQLGILTGLGMLLTLLHFYTLCPALAFSVVGRAAIPKAHFAHLGVWAGRAVRHARIVLIAASLLGLGSLLAARGVEVDGSLMNLRPQDSHAAHVQTEIVRKFGDFTGTGAVFVRRSDLEDALRQTEALTQQLREYRAEGALRSVHSISAILPSAGEQRERLERYNALPRSAVIALLQESMRRQGFAAEPFEDFFTRFRPPRSNLVTIDDAALTPFAFPIDRHVRSIGGEHIVATYLEPSPGVEWNTIARRLREDMPGVGLQIASRQLLETELGFVLGRELGFFLALAMAANLILLRLILGNFTATLAILTPVTLALLIVLSVMSITGTALDPINLIIIPLILGIGIDDGVYIVVAARMHEDIAETVRATGRALLVTSMTTIAGFGFLGTSRYPALATMGLLVSLGVFLCLIGSIILLPVLLARTGGHTESDG